MKYIILVFLSLVLLSILYLYFRARYIERNIEFGIKVGKIDFTESQILDVLTEGKLRFNALFKLNVTNKSNFSLKLKKIRVIITTESGNISIYSEEIKSVKISEYESKSIELPSEVIAMPGAIGELLSLIRGEGLEVNYKVMGRISILPLFHEGTIQL